MVLSNAIASAGAAINQGQVNEGFKGMNYNAANALTAFIILILYILLILIIGKFLWNEILCKLVTIAKPADSIWQLLGLAILFWLLLGN